MATLKRASYNPQENKFKGNKFMSIGVPVEAKTKEELIKELKVTKAQLALFEEEQARRKKAEEEVQLLQTITSACKNCEDFYSILEVALCKICDVTGWVIGEAWIPQEDNGCLELSSVWYSRVSGLEEFKKASEKFKFIPGQGLPGRVWTSKKSLWIQDVTKDPNFLRADLARDFKLKSALGVPILVKDKVVAVLVFFMFETKEEDAGLVGLVSSVASQLGTVIEKEETKKDLKESREHFSGIFNSSKDAIGYATLDGTLIDINDSFCKLTGYSQEEMLNIKRYQEITPPEYHEFEAKEVGEVVRTGKPREYEKEYIRKDGSRIPIHLTVFVVKGSHGETIGVAAIIRDITEQKKQEEELKLLNETLRKQLELEAKCKQKFFDSIVENIPDMIFVKDAKELKFVHFNKAGEKLLGYKREDLIGKNDYDFFPDKEADFFTERDRTVLEGKKLVVIPEEPIHTKDLGERILHTKKIPILDEQGEPQYLLGISEDITERKAKDEAIKSCRDSFRLLFAGNPNPMFVYDLETLGFLEVNKAMQKHYSWTRDELLKMKITDIRPKEEIPRLLEALKQERDDFQNTGLWKHKKKDGEIIDVETVSHLIEFNKRNSALVVVRDVTLEKRQEEELKAQEKKYRTLVEQIPTITYIADLEIDAGTIYISPQVELILGYSPEEWQKDPKLWSKLLFPEDKDRVVKKYIQSRSAGEPLSLEYRMITRNGSIVWLQDKALVIKDNEGKPCFIQGIMHNITELKKQQEENMRLASIVETADDAILSWTVEGKNVSWNKAAEKIFGYTASEIKDKHVNILVPQDKRQELDEILKRVKHGEQVINFETIRLRKGGVPINVSLTVSPVRDITGKITGLSTIARDITLKKRLEQEMEKINLHKQHEKELADVDKLVKSPKRDTITKLFGFAPLSVTLPEVFNDLLNRYCFLLNEAVKDYKKGEDHSVSDEISFIGKQLGFLKAGPSDLLELHSKAMKLKTKETSFDEIQTCREAGRKLVLELMSCLATYYRNSPLIVRRTEPVNGKSQKKGNRVLK